MWEYEKSDTIFQKREEVEAELERWRRLECEAQVWHYTASFARLQIRLHKVHYPHNLMVVCTDTLHLSGPMAWDVGALKISQREETRVFKGKRYTISHTVLSDASVGFEVVCAGILVARDVEPVFWRD